MKRILIIFVLILFTSECIASDKCRNIFLPVATIQDKTFMAQLDSAISLANKKNNRFVCVTITPVEDFIIYLKRNKIPKPSYLANNTSGFFICVYFTNCLFNGYYLKYNNIEYNFDDNTIGVLINKTSKRKKITQTKELDILVFFDYIFQYSNGILFQNTDDVFWYYIHE